jgi:Trp operon repressor
MKENNILTRIKILKALFVSNISQRRLSRKIKVHHNTIGSIVKKFKENSNP